MQTNDILPGSFSLHGTIVTLTFLEKLLFHMENEDKTIKEFLIKENLYHKKNYLVSHVFLVNTLYGIFLNSKENISSYSPDEELFNNTLNETLNKYFDVKKNCKKYKLSRAIRNSLAHYNIEFAKNGYIYFYDCDHMQKTICKKPNDSLNLETNSEKDRELNAHFIAEITTANLRLLISDLDKKLNND